MRKTISLVLAAAAGVLALSLTGCGTGHQSIVTDPGSAGHTTVVSEHSNGKTVHVAVGDKIELLLHSTYWNIAPSPHPSVLSASGGQKTLKSASACPPGVGCNPVAVTFTAAAPGTVMLTASRTSCGEAMMCGPGQRHYQVTVVVTR